MSAPDDALWSDRDGALEARAAWDPAAGEVVVSVTLGERRAEARFRPAHEPIFGLDVADHARSLELAEELAARLERETGPGSAAS